MDYFPAKHYSSQTKKGLVAATLANVALATGALLLAPGCNYDNLASKPAPIEQLTPEKERVSPEDYAKSLPPNSKVLIGWYRWQETLPGPDQYRNEFSNPSRQKLEEELERADRLGLTYLASTTRDVLSLTTRLKSQGIDFYVTPLIERNPLPGFHVLNYKPTEVVTGVSLTSEQIKSLKESYARIGSNIKAVNYLNSGKLEELVDK